MNAISFRKTVGCPLTETLINNMKPFEIAKSRMFGNESAAVIALLACFWMNSTSHSFGQEGGQGDITITGGPSCGGSVNVSGSDTITPYEGDPVVTVANSLTSSSTTASIDGDWGSGNWIGTWGFPVTVGLSTGLNVISASDNYNSSAMITIEIKDNGAVWNYAEQGQGNCELDMAISVCDNFGHSDKYKIYEMESSETENPPNCFKMNYTFPAVECDTDSSGMLSFVDSPHVDNCPPYSSSKCVATFDKVWFVRDFFTAHIETFNHDVLTFDEETDGKYKLSISDDKISPGAFFN